MRYEIADEGLVTVFLTNERDGRESGGFYLVDAAGREYGPDDEVPARDSDATGLVASDVVISWLVSHGFDATLTPLDATARAAAHAYLHLEERRVEERATRKARWTDAVTRLKVAHAVRDRQGWNQAKDEVDAIRELRADDLMADLAQAEQQVAKLAPEVLIRLDEIAEAYGRDRDTWVADLESGDMPPTVEADVRAVSLRQDAWTRMARVFYGRDPPAWRRDHEARRSVRRLARVVLRLGKLSHSGGYIEEYIAESLGDRGPRYQLGF